MKICLVGHLPGTINGSVTGGAERQRLLLAEGMVSRGHEVICVVSGGIRSEMNQSGVRIIPGWDDSIGPGGLRWVTYRLPNLRRTLSDLNADVYYCRGFSIFAPTVVSAAHSRGVQAWLGLASDLDLVHYKRAGDLRWNLLGRWSNGRLASNYFLRRGLRKADCVIAQNQDQFHACCKLRLRTQLIRNILPPVIVPNAPAQGSSTDVVWVGSLSRKKGLDTLDDIASSMDDVSFEIVGPMVDPTLSPLLDRLINRDNVTWVGELPHDKVVERIACAKILLNTSPHEGFPNTMLEAWALGKPVLSISADPDGLLSREERLGECACGNVESLRSAIRRWLADEAVRKEAGINAMQYVKKNHSPDVICEAYERLMDGKI